MSLARWGSPLPICRPWCGRTPLGRSSRVPIHTSRCAPVARVGSRVGPAVSQLLHGRRASPAQTAAWRCWTCSCRRSSRPVDRGFTSNAARTRWGGRPILVEGCILSSLATMKAHRWACWRWRSAVAGTTFGTSRPSTPPTGVRASARICTPTLSEQASTSSEPAISMPHSPSIARPNSGRPHRASARGSIPKKSSDRPASARGSGSRSSRSPVEHAASQPAVAGTTRTAGTSSARTARRCARPMRSRLRPVKPPTPHGPKRSRRSGPRLAQTSPLSRRPCATSRCARSGSVNLLGRVDRSHWVSAGCLHGQEVPPAAPRPARAHPATPVQGSSHGSSG